jgi:hypothetical protein
MSVADCTTGKSLWQRLDLLPKFYLSLLLLLCGLIVWRPLTGNEDFWAHAGVGRWMCQTRQFPHHALFLWSSSEPWIAHSWLTQLVFYGLTLGEELVRPAPVLVFTALLVAVPFVFAWRLCGRHRPLSVWLIVPFALGMEASYPRFQARPEIFTAVGLALLLTFLSRWSAPDGRECLRRFGKSDAWAALGLGLLFMVWANFHGAVLVGVLLLFVTAACDLVQDRFDRRSRMLVLLALVAPAAVCINPYGLAYWQAFLPVSGFTFAHIREWNPLWKANPMPWEEISIEIFLLVLALTAWSLNPQRRWAHLVWVLMLAGLFLRARRNIWLLTIVSLTVFAVNSHCLVLTSERLWQKWGRRPGQPAEAEGRRSWATLRWALRLALVVWLLLQIGQRAAVLYLYDTFRPTHLEDGVVRFVKEHSLTGRMYNDYENSSYLQWRFAGHPPLFIDLLNAYPDQVTQDYLDILEVTPRGRELLDELDIGFVVLTVTRPGPSLAKLADSLDQDRRWKRVYADGDGMIWVRRTPEYRPVWDTPAVVRKTLFGYLEMYNKSGEP